MELSVQLHAPAALPLGKEALNRQLGGPQSRSGYCAEKFLSLPGIEQQVRGSSDSYYSKLYWHQ
jgi:hypothetical protein